MKKWTILIYANGNNDLEPEVYQRFTELKNLDIDDSCNVIVQIGRANIDLVRSLRPSVLIDTKQDWNGVRRYKIESSQAILLEDMGNLNMADPSSFVDFVSWGMGKYTDPRIMVVISGHGAGFVGVMTDYTKNRPYMMDIFGLTSSLYNIKAKTKKTIDCLVLDACYMNMLELWNEIALIPNNPIKYLSVPSKNIELKGMSYSSIIKTINSRIILQRSLIYTVGSINKEFKNKDFLLLVKLKKGYFNRLRKEINHISKFISERDLNLRLLLNKWCLTKPIDPLIGVLDLMGILYEKYTEIFKKRNLEKILQKIIVHPKISIIHRRLNQGPSLYLPFNLKQYLELSNYYDQLSFLEDNSWLKVIGGENNVPYNHDKKQYNQLPLPMKIPVNYVVASILDQNPDLSTEELLDIMSNLGWL